MMCITAHPDDESGAFGGALMLAHARGAESSVICLTDGGAATHRGNAASDEELAQLRRQEFAAALRILQVDHGEVLRYPDGGLARQDFVTVTAQLIQRIRQFRPHVVLTFGADGGVNLHPDHTMVCFFATAAFHWAGIANSAAEPKVSGSPPYRPQKLYYSSPPFLSNPNMPGASQVASVPATLVLQLGELKTRKLEAFLEHKTQAAIVIRVREIFEKHSEEERYLLAAARGICLNAFETDMFQGLEED
jgi:LmbE family N-acetylglucosaminyl deacetylase